MAERTQRSNILLAFISLTAVIAVVSLIGFFTLGKGPEIIQGQAEADEYRVSGKVPARILELRVKEGNKVKAGDTLVILEAPDVMAKLSQAQAAELFRWLPLRQIVLWLHRAFVRTSRLAQRVGSHGCMTSRQFLLRKYIYANQWEH